MHNMDAAVFDKLVQLCVVFGGVDRAGVECFRFRADVLSIPFGDVLFGGRRDNPDIDNSLHNNSEV